MLLPTLLLLLASARAGNFSLPTGESCSASDAWADMDSYSEAVAVWQTAAELADAFAVALSPNGALLCVSTATTGTYVLDWDGGVAAYADATLVEYLSDLQWEESGIFGSAQYGVFFAPWPAANLTFELVLTIGSYPTISRLPDSGDFLFGLQEAYSELPGCQVARLPATLNATELSCFTGALEDYPRGVLPLSETEVAVVGGTSEESTLSVVSATSTGTVSPLVSGYPLSYPIGMAAATAAWSGADGEYDIIVANFYSYDNQPVTVVGVSSTTGAAAVLAADDALYYAQSVVVNATNDVLLVASASGLVLAAPCSPVEADPVTAAESAWVIVGLAAAGVAVLALGAVLVQRRRRALMPSSALEERLLGGIVDDDLTLGKDRWVIKLNQLRKKELIGHGSFGQVFAGKYMGSSNVAIKVLPCNLSPESLQRVKVETKTAVSMFHPFVLRCLGAAVDADNYEVNLVVELCKRSLQEMIDDPAAAAKLEARRRKYALQIAQAFQYLHANRVVHRDLKPANVLIHADGNVRVSDFGQSRDLRMETFKATVMAGTPGYAAPEVIAGGDSVGGAADVFSFGVLLNTMATREAPFLELRHLTPHDVMSRVVAGQRPTLCGLAESEPEYVQLIADCWEANPRDRPSFDDIVMRLQGGTTTPRSWSTASSAASHQDALDPLEPTEPTERGSFSLSTVL